jgi:hypothetical protein
LGTIYKMGKRTIEMSLSRLLQGEERRKKKDD